MISILLATYNGEKYLTEQLDSLFNQTVPFDTLYIQDDCSTDGTWELLESYQQQRLELSALQQPQQHEQSAPHYGQPITNKSQSAQRPWQMNLCKNQENSGSAKYNFYSLMSRVRDEYILLCDQDDVWLPDKIKKTLTKMHELEKQYGADTPLLVHTDLTVVDAQLNVISPSFKTAMNANYHRTRLNELIIQNTLTGCTALYNRALAELIKEQNPEFMVMHDWWLILVASTFGHIDSLDEMQTVLYRQHGTNEIGAADVRTLRYKIHKLRKYREIKEALSNTYIQASSLLAYYYNQLSAEQVAFLTDYCKIPAMNKLNRWRAICRLNVQKNGIARKIANFIFI